MRGLIIVPAFNEEASITSTLARLQSRPAGSDVLVVDDGSKDATARLARAAGARVVSLPFNLGIGAAVQTGYILAAREDYDWALQFDADGQHPASAIDRMVNALEGQACVVGSRYLVDSGYKSSVPRRLGSRYFSLLLALLGCPGVTDPSSGFRICDRRAIALFARRYPLDYPEVEAHLLLARRRLPVREMAVSMSRREGGKSSINTLDSVFYMFKVTLSLSLGGGR
ncbi:MAG: glycosyltransferase family 2 protein [Planctomycetota bacterium]